MLLTKKDYVLVDGLGPLRPKPSRAATRILARSLVVTALAVLQFVGEGQAVTIDTVPVGNAGNAADQYYAYDNPDHLQFGTVSYDYRIGTYEVTNAQYAEFLNAKAKSDPYGLYNQQMASTITRGGIARNGAEGSYVYSALPNMSDKPVTWVSWFDAVRFVNWLNNGQGPGDTETGAYTLLGGTPTPSNADSIARNAGATWFLPNEDEWYKAAYYDPTLQDGTGGYWDYPTQSNRLRPDVPFVGLPVAATANNTGDIANPGPRIANFGKSAHWNGLDGNLTTVGSAGSLSASPYGTFDQGGNVNEWLEGGENSQFPANRAWRGGDWNAGRDYLLSSNRSGAYPYSELNIVGFRVATIANVPEPSTLALSALAAVGLLFTVRKRRRVFAGIPASN